MQSSFTRVSLEDVLRADADGMPVFRKCFENEILLSFFDDDGAYAFHQWWVEHGAAAFGEWLIQQEEYQHLMR